MAIRPIAEIATARMMSTSTIQTRARYFLFVPWVYRELEAKRVPSDKARDRARKGELVNLINRLCGDVDFVAQGSTKATRGAAVVVATPAVEVASEFADRVGLLGDGVVIADGPMAEILSGGWYFATEVARVLDFPGVVTPAQGAAALREEAP